MCDTGQAGDSSSCKRGRPSGTWQRLENETDALGALQLYGRQRGVHMGHPIIQVSHGDLLSQAEWEADFDFVVAVVIFSGNQSSLCSGTGWGNKVLTAAHCGEETDTFFVTSARHQSRVTSVDRHPSFTPPSFADDYMILTP